MGTVPKRQKAYISRHIEGPFGLGTGDVLRVLLNDGEWELSLLTKVERGEHWPWWTCLSKRGHVVYI